MLKNALVAVPQDLLNLWIFNILLNEIVLSAPAVKLAKQSLL
jgi:hypothetical protein